MPIKTYSNNDFQGGGWRLKFHLYIEEDLDSPPGDHVFYEICFPYFEAGHSVIISAKLFEYDHVTTTYGLKQRSTNVLIF